MKQIFIVIFMKMIKWEYSKKLNDKGAIDKFEKKYSIEFPSYLKKIMSENNGGFPTPYVCTLYDEEENDFNKLLSFNEDDDDSIFDVADYFIPKGYIPFGCDSYNGYYCIHENYVVYINFLNDNIDLNDEYILAESVEEFFDSLH